VAGSTSAVGVEFEQATPTINASKTTKPKITPT